MKKLFSSSIAVAGAVLLSAGSAVPSMAQLTMQQNQSLTQVQGQQMQGQGTATMRSSRSQAAGPLSGSQEVALLNELSAQGYQPRGEFQKVGNIWQMPAVDSKGQSTTVMLDPSTGQVSAQQSGGGTVAVTTIPSRDGTMSGAPDGRTQRQQRR